MKFRRVLLLILLVLGSIPLGLDQARSNVRVLPRAIEDFALVGEHLSNVETVWVEGSQLAWVNYSAIRRDFPALNNLSEAQIDKLLIFNFSYISKVQLELNGIRNTQIPADPTRSRPSYRPLAYGRADILEFRDFDGHLLGLIDRKGTGVTNRHSVERNRKELERRPLRETSPSWTLARGFFNASSKKRNYGDSKGSLWCRVRSRVDPNHRS